MAKNGGNAAIFGENQVVLGKKGSISANLSKPEFSIPGNLKSDFC